MACDASFDDSVNASNSFDAPSEDNPHPTTVKEVPTKTSFEKNRRLNIKYNATKLQ